MGYEEDVQSGKREEPEVFYLVPWSTGYQCFTKKPEGFSIPVVREDQQGYDQISKLVKTAPMTWLPGLISDAVEAAIDKRVFANISEGLINFVTKVAKRREEHNDRQEKGNT